MKFLNKAPNKLTLISAAAYFFVFALCAKGVYLYAAQHPPKDQLIFVHGSIAEVHLGGQGRSTFLKIASEAGVFRYSTYYGKVWPGMSRLHPGDQVDLLAEKNRLNRNEFIEGKSYYLWELIHQRQIIIHFQDVLEMVRSKEATVNHYINIWLQISIIFLLIAWLRKIYYLKNR